MVVVRDHHLLKRKFVLDTMSENATRDIHVDMNTDVMYLNVASLVMVHIYAERKMVIFCLLLPLTTLQLKTRAVQPSKQFSEVWAE